MQAGAACGLATSFGCSASQPSATLAAATQVLAAVAALCTAVELPPPCWLGCLILHHQGPESPPAGTPQCVDAFLACCAAPAHRNPHHLPAPAHQNPRHLPGACNALCCAALCCAMLRCAVRLAPHMRTCHAASLECSLGGVDQADQGMPMATRPPAALKLHAAVAFAPTISAVPGNRSGLHVNAGPPSSQSVMCRPPSPRPAPPKRR